MSKALFADQASSVLSTIVKTWAMRTNYTSAAAAEVLVATAVEKGFLRDREKLLTGSLLNAWGRKKKAPRWAMQSAMAMLIDDGWQPVTNAEWAAFASLYIMTVNADTLALALERLPVGMDRAIAAGWICAAAENAARYYEGKHRR